LDVTRKHMVERHCHVSICAYLSGW